AEDLHRLDLERLLEGPTRHLLELASLVRFDEALDLLDGGLQGIRDLLLRLLRDVLVVNPRREATDHDRADRHLRGLVDEDPRRLPPFLTSGGGRSRMSILLRMKVTSSRVNLLSLCVRRNDPVMWSWIPPITGPPNRGDRMCSWTRMRTRASARASSLWRTWRFISSPSKSALYGGHTARLKRKVLWGITRTSWPIIDIRWSDGCRLKRTMSPSTSCRSTV